MLLDSCQPIFITRNVFIIYTNGALRQDLDLVDSFLVCRFLGEGNILKRGACLFCRGVHIFQRGTHLKGGGGGKCPPLLPPKNYSRGDNENSVKFIAAKHF